MFKFLRSTAKLSNSASAYRRLANKDITHLRKAFYSEGPLNKGNGQGNAEANVFNAQNVAENNINAGAATISVNKPTYREALSANYPFLGKVADFMVETWEQTFPSEQYQAKAELLRKQAKINNELEMNKKIYTEEELAQIQEAMPEWKRTAMTEFSDGALEEKSYKDKLVQSMKDNFNNTELARKLYNTEAYKEYEDFKKEMSQFREDLKDHLGQSQNPAVIVSMHLLGKVSTESSTATAIAEMKKYTKNFNVFELEKDVRGIFVDAYNAYLKGDAEYIEKVSEDDGRAYFKALMRKREFDKVTPMHTQVWNSEPAEFVTGRMSDRNMPLFNFTITIQEIHCNVSNKTKKIVDGAEDRLVQHRFSVSLSPHDAPDLEQIGHSWNIVDIKPMEAMPLLA